MIRFEFDEDTKEIKTEIGDDLAYTIAATHAFINEVYNKIYKKKKGEALLFQVAVQAFVKDDNSPTWEIDEEEQDE